MGSLFIKGEAKYRFCLIRTQHGRCNPKIAVDLGLGAFLKVDFLLGARLKRRGAPDKKAESK